MNKDCRSPSLFFIPPSKRRGRGEERGEDGREEERDRREGFENRDQYFDREVGKRYHLSPSKRGGTGK